MKSHFVDMLPINHYYYYYIFFNEDLHHTYPSKKLIIVFYLILLYVLNGHANTLQYSFLNINNFRSLVTSRYMIVE